MTAVLPSASRASLSSLDAQNGRLLFHESNISLASQNSLSPNEEDMTITVKGKGSLEANRGIDELQLLAVSSQITEVGYSISDVQTRIFEIQELRHRTEAQSASGTTPAETNGGSTNNIDQALINLDERLEAISSSVNSIDAILAPLHNANSKTPTTASSQTPTQQITFSNDSTAALLRKHAAMLQEWDSVQEEAETLKGELREDKWLAVFRTVGEQAEAMMVSLEKAISHCQEFIWQVSRNRKALTEDGQSAISSGSFSADKPINYEMFQSLQSSYDAKKRYYMPATTKVLSILDRSVRDRVTKNGECLRRHAEARARWKNLRERINRIDSEMESVRLFFVNKDKEQEREPSEAGSALSRQTSKSNFTSKSNYLSTPSTRASGSASRSRASSSTGTPSAFSRSMSPLKRLASKVTASVRSSTGGSTGRETPSMNSSSVSVASSAKHSSLAPSPLLSQSSNGTGPPRPPPRNPNRPTGNRIAVSSPGIPDPAEVGKDKKKRESLFPFLSKPPPPSALGRSTNRAPSRSSMSGGDTSSSAASKPKWTSSTKIQYDDNLPPPPASQNATIRASPSRPSIVDQVFRPLSPPEGGRSTSRADSRPGTSQGRYTARHSLDQSISGAPRVPSRAPSRSGARTPSGHYGTSPRTRPTTPSHIPAPVSYTNGARSPSRAASESDYEPEIPTTLMQRAFTPSFASEGPKRRRPSESLIPVPKLNVTSNSRPGTALSMSYSHRSGSPAQSDGTGRKSPRESPSAWKTKDSPSNPFTKDSSSPGRAGARSQTPEAMLRSRALHLPLYMDGNTPGGATTTPGSKARGNAPSSFKGEPKTLVFGPGPSNNNNASNGPISPGQRPSSRSASRNASYGFGRMTPSLDGPLQPYVPVKTDELDVEVANVVNGMAHGFLFERVDPPRKGPARPGEEIKAQYAISNVLGRKVISCRLVTITRSGTQSKKVMCRVGGGWLELQMYILNRQAGLS